MLVVHIETARANAALPALGAHFKLDHKKDAQAPPSLIPPADAP